MATTGNPSEREKQAASMVAQFESWAAKKQREVLPYVVESALYWRSGTDGESSRWTPSGLRELLLEWLPRRAPLRESELSLSLATLHAWLDFRTESGEIVDPNPLHSVIDDNAAEFRTEMLDQRNYGLNKFWSMQMLEHDVDLTDESSIKRFIEAAQSGEITIDRDALAEIRMRNELDVELAEVEDNSEPEPQVESMMPPMPLPSEEELEQLANDTTLVRAARKFLEWAAEGKKLTGTNKLVIADARDLAGELGLDKMTIQYARTSKDLRTVTFFLELSSTAGIIRAENGRLSLGETQPQNSLALWHELFRASSLVSASVWPVPLEEGSPVGQKVPQAFEQLWVSLYAAANDYLPLELITYSARGRFESRLVDQSQDMLDYFRPLWRKDFFAMVSVMRLLGAVDLVEIDDEQTRANLPNYTSETPVTKRIVPTPLGFWSTRESMRTAGLAAPSVEEVVQLPLRDMVAALDLPMPEDNERHIYTAWVNAREASEAAKELAEFIATHPSAEKRLFALEALEKTGDRGVEQARKLRARGGVVGAMASQWLYAHDHVARGALDDHEVLLSLAESMIVAYEEGRLSDMLMRRPVDEQISVVRAVAVSAHPTKTGLLTEIATKHPVRRVAKEARKLRDMTAKKRS